MGQPLEGMGAVGEAKAGMGGALCDAAASVCPRGGSEAQGRTKTVIYHVPCSAWVLLWGTGSFHPSESQCLGENVARRIGLISKRIHELWALIFSIAQ